MDKNIKKITLNSNKCESCGGNLEIDFDKKKGFCPYCRSEYIIETEENKKSTIDTVIGFIEKQQQIKQDKKDEEEKKIEEERQKQRESFEANKMKYLISFGAGILLLIIIGVVGSISENIEKNKNLKAGKVAAPISYEDVKGKNYEDVEKKFKKAGFTNIETKGLGDMVVGIFSDEGDVDKVSIDGETEYSSSEYFEKDAEVVIRYHSYPSKDNTDNEKKKVNKKKKDEKESEEEEKDEIITVDNNELFNKIINARSPENKDVQEFADKYSGKTIEFDGNIQFLELKDGYDTRYSLMVNSKDYKEDCIYGPNFRFKNIGANDFKIDDKDDNMYYKAPLNVGDSVRITATVGEFNPDTQVFDLYSGKIVGR